MQQKYLDQFHEFYEDFNITKLQFFPKEVHCMEFLKSFIKKLIKSYVLEPAREHTDLKRIQELKTKVVYLQIIIINLQSKLQKLRKNH